MVCVFCGHTSVLRKESLVHICIIFGSFSELSGKARVCGANQREDPKPFWGSLTVRSLEYLNPLGELRSSQCLIVSYRGNKGDLNCHIPPKKEFGSKKQNLRLCSTQRDSSASPLLEETNKNRVNQKRKTCSHTSCVCVPSHCTICVKQMCAMNVASSFLPESPSHYQAGPHSQRVCTHSCHNPNHQPQLPHHPKHWVRAVLCCVVWGGVCACVCARGGACGAKCLHKKLTFSSVLATRVGVMH